MNLKTAILAAHMVQVNPLVIARILSVQSIYLLSIYLGSN